MICCTVDADAAVIAEAAYFMGRDTPCVLVLPEKPYSRAHAVLSTLAARHDVLIFSSVKDACLHLIEALQNSGILKQDVPALKVVRKYNVGCQVKARYEGGYWDEAVVLKVNVDGTFHVRYRNGDVEQSVSPSNMKL